MNKTVGNVGGLALAAFAWLHPLRAPAAEFKPGEVDRLLEEVAPPARFAAHKPDFQVKDVELTYHWWREGQIAPITQSFRVICDGALPIALLNDGFFFSRYPGADTSDFLGDTFNPVHKRSGTEIPDGSPIDRYRDEVLPTRAYDIHKTGETLEYTVSRGPWPRDPDAVFGARSRFTFRVDPVLGYVIERHTEWRNDRPPMDNSGRAHSFGNGGWYSAGITSFWPEERSYDYTGYAQPLLPGKDVPRFRIYANNSESMFRRHHPPIRARGFVAYLRDREGWGLLSTYEQDVDTHYNKCPIWGGIHMHTTLIETDHGGWRSGEVRMRTLTLPPEMVESIIGQAETVAGNGHTILVRVDGEGFEDQPRPVSTPERGFQPEHNAPYRVRISDQYAKTGSKSLEVEGISLENFVSFKFFPRDRAHTRFRPGRRYRLECWLRVEGEGTQAFVLFTPGLGLGAEELAAGQGVGTHRTASVFAGEGWQEVSVEFTGSMHGTPVNVHFIVLGEGKGYVDDFRLYELPVQN